MTEQQKYMRIYVGEKRSPSFPFFSHFRLRKEKICSFRRILTDFFSLGRTTKDFVASSLTKHRKSCRFIIGERRMSSEDGYTTKARRYVRIAFFTPSLAFLSFPFDPLLDHLVLHQRLLVGSFDHAGYRLFGFRVQ